MRAEGEIEGARRSVLTSFLLNRVPGEGFEKILNTLSSTLRGVLMDPRGAPRQLEKVFEDIGAISREDTADGKPRNSSLVEPLASKDESTRSAVKKKKKVERSRLCIFKVAVRRIFFSLN